MTTRWRRLLAVAASVAATVSVGAIPVAAAAAGFAPTAISPASGSTVQPPPQITATFPTALNTLPGFSTIQVTVGGSPVAGSQSFADNNHTIVLTPSARLADGQYVATVSARDTSIPSQSGTTSWTFSVDGTPPPEPVIDPLPVVNAATDTSVTFSGSETESSASITVHLYSDGPEMTAQATRDGSAWGVTLDLSSLPDGGFGLQADARDGAGNTTSAWASGTKDTAPPARAATAPADGATVGAVRTVTVSWNEQVEPSSVAMGVRRGDGAEAAGSVSVAADRRSSTFTFDSLPDAADDPWTVSASATDLSGNADPSPSTTTFDVQRPGLGTDVCGSIPGGVTVWSAAGAPYRLCTDGVTVNNGSELDLDGSQGPFAVVAEGSGGLSVDSGIIRTVNTDAADRVSFDSADGAPWAGISATFSSSHVFGPMNSTQPLDISYVNVAHPTTGVRVYPSDPPGEPPSATLDHVTVSSASSDGVLVESAQVTVSNSDIVGAAADGIHVDCELAGSAKADGPVVVDHDDVSGATAIGIDVRNCADPQVTNNVVTRSGDGAEHLPAMLVISIGFPGDPYGPYGMQLGAATGVSGNTGDGNGLDAIALGGDQKGGFTWITPTVASSVHPLGYLNLGLMASGTGTVTMPAGSLVKSGSVPALLPPDGTARQPGQLLIDGPQLRTEVGTVFTSLSDDSQGFPTCTSALATTCQTDDTSWPGLKVVTGAELDGTTIRHAVVGVQTQDFGPNGPVGAPVSGSGDTVYDCQVGFYANDLSLSSTTVSDMHVTDLPWSGRAIDMHGSLALHGVTITHTDGIAISAVPMASTTTTQSTLDVEGLTIDHAFRNGLVADENVPSDTEYDDPIVTGLTVTHSWSGGSINATHMSVGPGRHIDALTGAANVNDRIGLGGSFVGGLTWVTPTNSDSLHPLGYTGAFTFLGGQLTVGAGATVSASRIDLDGATLDASAGDIHITDQVLLAEDGPDGTPPAIRLSGVMWDGLAGASNVPGPMEPGFNVAAADADVVIADSALIGPGAVNSSNAPGDLPLTFAGPVSLDRDSFVGIGLRVNGGHLADSVLGDANRAGSVTVTGNVLFRMAGDVFQSADLSSIVVIGGVLEMHRVRITGGHNAYASTTASHAVVIARNQATITGDCNSITGNDAGLSTDASSSATSSDSDIVDNNSYDVYAGGGPVNVERTWWGQAEGPTPAEAQGGPIDASDPAPSQRPEARLTSTSDATQPDGGFGTGTLTVVVDFNRRMDTTVQPTVTMTGPDGKPHRISGDWISDDGWSGHYDVSPSTASGGTNRIDASGARGCVNDPSTNLMQPASSTVSIDEPPGTTITGGPANRSFSRPIVAFSFASNAPNVTSGCRLDGGSWTPCSSPASYTDLSDGQHTFSVRSTNGGGTGLPSTRTWSVDGSAPTVTVGRSSLRYQLGQTAKAAFAARDAGSGVASYDIRLATGSWRTRVGAWQQPQRWQRTTATSVAIGIAAGQTRCFSVRARDRVGNLSKWSERHCVARPVDDRALLRRTGSWTRALNRHDYSGTLTRADRTGSELALLDAVVTRIALLVTTCRTCGRVTVSVGGHVVATVSLYSPGTDYRRYLRLPAFRLRTGRIVLHDAAGRARIDGLVVTTV
jgi:hypothetical protein